MALVDNIISAESGGDPTARNPRSSATGAGQFVDGTWLDMVSRNRPDLMQGRSPEEVLALRNDPQFSKEMVAAYARDNAKVLTDAGLPVTPGTVYLAHFAGPQGAVKLLTADPTTPAGSVLGDKVAAANPFLRNMTTSDLAAWAGRKAGGGTPNASGAAAAPPPAVAPPQGIPAQAEPAAAPLFGGMGQGAAQPTAAMPLTPQSPQAQPGMAQPGAQAGALPMTSDPLALPQTAMMKQRMLAALLGRQS